uniref:Uncharacterized protein n=1 Tax=Morganella morganii TaxID=582 RepID=D2N267_MORMO|nr:hypothetical protein [Morganella morganii subsp. morganii]
MESEDLFSRAAFLLRNPLHHLRLAFCQTTDLFLIACGKVGRQPGNFTFRHLDRSAGFIQPPDNIAVTDHFHQWQYTGNFVISQPLTGRRDGCPLRQIGGIESEQYHAAPERPCRSHRIEFRFRPELFPGHHAQTVGTLTECRVIRRYRHAGQCLCCCDSLRLRCGGGDHLKIVAVEIFQNFPYTLMKLFCCHCPSPC